MEGYTNHETPGGENTIDDNKECVICNENRRSYAISPCGHLCLCNSCVNTVSSCPLCRSDIKETIRIYAP